jgi:ribosomal protein S18 acetylase RimI-like enzyme
MATNAIPGASVRVRSATREDMAAMIAVINAAFVVEDFIEGTRTDAANMSELMQKGEFLVAEGDARQVVACVYTEVRRDRGYLGMLAVDPRRQGSGLGRIMAEAAEKHLRERDCRWIDLRVLSPRRELLPFYEKLGYVQVRTEEFRPPRPLREGFECYGIIMSKAL